MSNQNIIFCSNHSNNKSFGFCEECQEFICPSCLFSDKHISHLQKIKSLKDILNSYFPNINNFKNISHLLKYIDLFHFILNYNSSFMPFDLNEIMNQINSKFDNYINKLIELKIQFKILLSEKFGILQEIYYEQEKKIIETQNKLIYILNKEDLNYLEKMNTYLEQIRLNQNKKKIMEFIEEYNKLIIKAFENDKDFEDKYKFFMAQKLIEKNNRYIKENILDKYVQNFFEEAIKNIDNLFHIINNQHNKDIESLKKQLNNINIDYNLNEEEKQFNKNSNKNLKLNDNNNSIKNVYKTNEKNPEKEINQINSEIKKENNNNNSQKESNNVNINKEEEKTNKNNSKLELLKIEFDPPEIETCQFTEKELAEMDMDDDYENEFLKIEEDGDDGLLLAEIIDGNCSENATVDIEQFYIDNMDDKLDIQYYEGIKFEGEEEGLNDEAIVFEDEVKEEVKEEIKKKDEIKKEVEINKEEMPKKLNKIEEIKRQLMSNNNKLNNPIQTKFQQRPITPTPHTNKQNEQKKDKDKDINLAKLIKDNKINPKEKKEEIDKKLLELCELVKSGKRNTEEFNKKFDQISWESKGKIELFAVDPKNNSLKIYNYLTEKIDEIKLDSKLPLHLSYINLPPYLYISGGKSNGKDITSIQRIIRTGKNSVKIEEVSKLNQGRSNHCMIYIKNINSLFFISGSKIKTCEKYNFINNKIESFPSLKISREKCGACLLNEKYLYVFFGFDRNKNKFETSIERININDPINWEMINLIGNQNIFKKQSFACIPYFLDKQKGVIITGGINSLRNETKEIVFINIERNKGEVFSFLQKNSSFTNSCFISFDKYSCENEVINFSNEFNVIKFNLDKKEFI